MTRLTEADTQAMGRDLETCDLLEAIGNRPARAKARKQRKAIFAALKADNAATGADRLTDDELLAELGL